MEGDKKWLKQTHSSSLWRMIRSRWRMTELSPSPSVEADSKKLGKIQNGNGASSCPGSANLSLQKRPLPNMQNGARQKKAETSRARSRMSADSLAVIFRTAEGSRAQSKRGRSSLWMLTTWQQARAWMRRCWRLTSSMSALWSIPRTSILQKLRDRDLSFL